MERHAHTVHGAKVGDWLEARGLPGQPPRRGQIVEILGGPGHEHFRVRWDEQHESVFYPAEGVHVLTAEEIEQEAGGGAAP